MPGFVRFLSDLYETGQVRLPFLAHDSEVDFASLRAAEILADREAMVRLTLPGEAPPWEPEIALEGASWLYRCGQHYLERARSTEPLEAMVDAGIERLGTEPGVVYSLDLALRFLPDLVQRARLLSEDDGLSRVLMRLAWAWPLSSVGIPGVESDWARHEGWWEHPALRRLYADRVIERDDGGRVRNDPPVRDEVARCLGELWQSRAGDRVRQAVITGE
jgi:hypothetical protein